MTELPTFDCVPRDLQAIPRWVLWKFNAQGGKVPQGKTGNVSAHDPANWMSFHKAVATLHRILTKNRWPQGGGLGFVFTDDDDVGGVDLDGCRDPATGDIAPWANRVLEVFQGAYVEYSPSGKGFHILSRGSPKHLARTQRAIGGEAFVEGKAPGIEAYVTGRFFTVTGAHATGRMELLVRREAWVQIDAFLRGDEARHEREEEAHAAGKLSGDADIDLVRSALAAFGSDDLDRNGWVGVGMALKGEFGDDGKAMWLEWMARSPHDEAAANEKTWEGLPERPLKVGVGTIFYHAGQHGWKRPRKRGGGGGNVLTDAVTRTELWHDQRDIPYATVTVTRAEGASHKENIAVEGPGFANWLTREYYQTTGGTPKREEMKEAIGLARAKAMFDGPKHTTWIRTATADGKLYLDVGDEEWTAIEIDAEGWRMMSDPPVKFRRANGGMALPVPVRGDPAVAITKLGELIRPRRADQLKLLVGWMVACMRAGYPIPVLVLACEYGSAKSSALRAVRSFIDPRDLDTPGLPTTEKDVVVMAHQQWLFAADNITSLSPAMSDILCRVVTGGGIGGRSLYTNEDAHSITVKRPVALTSIGTITMRPDFVDRSMTMPLRRIEQPERLTEAEVAERLAEMQPLLMGALLDGASTALRRMDEAKALHAGRLPRMADFALWVEAAGEAFGWKDGEFLDAYLQMLEERLGETAADDPLCALILDWVCDATDGVIEGPAGELRERLQRYVDAGVEFSSPRRRYPSSEDWFPKRPRGLSSRLEGDRRLLASIGVTYTNRPHPHSKTRGQIHRLELNELGRQEFDARFMKAIGA